MIIVTNKNMSTAYKCPKMYSYISFQCSHYLQRGSFMEESRATFYSEANISSVNWRYVGIRSVGHTVQYFFVVVVVRYGCQL